MKIRVIGKLMNDNDTTTYILVGVIIVTILLGSLKIIFF